MKLSSLLLVTFPLVFCIDVQVLRNKDNHETTIHESSFLHHLLKRQGQRCGADGGGRTCAKGFCCSKQGWCGKDFEYCSSPACQVDFSDSCDGNIRPNGPDTANVDRPKKGDIPYGRGIYHCEKYGVIAITYDDGPYMYTEDLLDLLKRYDARATFFVTGRNLGKGAINDRDRPWRNLIKRMVSDGHQVASHTWSHQRLTQISDTQLYNQIVYNEIALADILGYFPTYLRPPYSSSNERVDTKLGELGYHVTYFNLDTEGYLHNSAGEIQRSKDIWDNAVEGKQVKKTKWLDVEHDPVYQTVYNLTEYMLKSIRRNGFRPVTVGECLDDPKQNWYRSVAGEDGRTALATKPNPHSRPSVQRCG